jgi:hypothetical protein
MQVKVVMAHQYNGSLTYEQNNAEHNLRLAKKEFKVVPTLLTADVKLSTHTS